MPQKAAAQAAVNAASFRRTALPNSGIAQGSVFTAFGTNVGGAGLVEALEFPLPTELGGSSISVTVGGTTVDCIILNTLPNRVTAILPSDTPTGEGTMTMTYNGSVATSFPVTAVDHSFGTFALNTAGSGPGVFQDPTTFGANTVTSSAAPGELWDVWGTGLGGAPFADDIQPPPGQDLGYDVQVFVGGQEAEVTFAGRSGCCSGVDQVRFVVPAGLSGCYVPVYLVVDGVTSNFTSVSISAAGGACADPGGLSAAALSDDSLTVGVISMSKTTSDIDIPDLPNLPGAAQSLSQTRESAAASYFGFDLAAAQRQSFNGALFTEGGCSLFQFTGENGAFSDPIEPIGLNAGATSISNGSRTEPLSMIEPGLYAVALTSPTPGFPLQGTPFFTGGTYLYTAAGGPDVGQYSLSITDNGGLAWQNKDEIDEVIRSQGQTITWTPYAGQTRITGFSFTPIGDTEEVVGAGFTCLAGGQTGSFTVPAAVLQAMPASQVISQEEITIETGSLSVAKVVTETCEATGLDVCVGSYADSISKTLGYR